MDINYLLFLQQLRELTGGILDTFILSLTALGEAPITWGLLALVYWCIDKRAGQLMALNVSFAGTMNQGLKNIFKIERPWVQDSRIQPVEAALGHAGGYSFPSGHTTRATATWGALAKALWDKKELGLSLLGGVICLIVGFSRNYLGVHTAKDVLSALLMGVVLIFVLDRILAWAEKGKYRDFVVGLAGGIIFLAFMLKVGSLSNAGAGVGLLLGWIVERRLIRFETEGSFREKAFRFATGSFWLVFLYTVPNTILGMFMAGKYAGFFSQCLFAFVLMAGYPFLFSRVSRHRHAEKKIIGVILLFVAIMAVAGVILCRVKTGKESPAQNKIAQEVSAQSEEIQTADADMPIEKVKVIGHRGYSSQFPENTMTSFRGACELGVDYIETDVQLTKDGVLVLFHDNDLSRITGVKGNVIDFTYEELCTMDAGGWFSAEFAGEKIPTLEELLDYLKGEECHIYLELKDIGEVEGFAEKVEATVAAYGMLDRCVFASFHYEYLKTIKAVDSGAEILYNTTADQAAVVAEYPAEYYGFSLPNVTADMVEAAHEAGSNVFVWTVDTPEDMSHVIALGVDGICSNKPELAKRAVELGESEAAGDIIILYTNDVHCSLEENIGYAGLVKYREEMEEQSPYVTLVDCGDAIQGEYIGLVSEGKCIVDVMNKAEYDYAIPGNHEFDYGLQSLNKLIEMADAQYLACNITYTGNGENELCGLKPYELVSYGNTTVAFIGVSTPESIISASPMRFMEGGRVVYDFAGGEDGKQLYDCVQAYVDECRTAGADYVVVLTHLGDSTEYAPFSSIDLARNTEGIDVILDGHAHSTIPCLSETNRVGEEVIISSTGSRLTNIGKLIISSDGNISTELISDVTEKDEAMQTFLEEMQAAFKTELSKKVAVSDVELSFVTEEGIRMVRNRETNIGDFCADAYRLIAGADIGLVNGGGIRGGLPVGEITYEDLYHVYPFGNSLCVVQATGQEILDCLEMSCRLVRSGISENGAAVGESGGFLQVSGLKFTVDTAIESSVVVDENGMFALVDGERRVRDVFVLSADGVYRPIEEERVYTVAANDYLLEQGGDGYSMFLDNEFPVIDGMQDYQVLAAYVTEILKGRIDKRYAEPEGRIVVE